MISIFDCSNSDERPHHRNGGGPIQNDIMRYLKEYCSFYNCKFVDNALQSDVVITNDVFPKDILKIDRPRLKRMCSPFWKADLQYRNAPLNAAANQANMVIFISEYSRKSYDEIFGITFKNVVIKHWVNPQVFATRDKYKDFSIVSSATDWKRPEKRIQALIDLANQNKNIPIYLIGKAEMDLPSNIIKVGYLSTPQQMLDIIGKCHLFVNFTYRDAATKTVPQALSCGLPILYSSSGGVKEYVNGYGFEIKEDEKFGIENEVPDFHVNLTNLSNFKMNIPDLSYLFKTMLGSYFEQIKKLT